MKYLESIAVSMLEQANNGIASLESRNTIESNPELILFKEVKAHCEKYLHKLKLKTMDTTTVLEIIRMLDKEIEDYNRLLSKAESTAWELQKLTLENFRDHLQSFIEGQVNALENQSPEQ